MPVIAMEVKTAQNHPHADALRVLFLKLRGAKACKLLPTQKTFTVLAISLL